MAGNPDLREGEQGEWVTYLQQLLARSGHSPGAEDGWFGPRTAGAVCAFQKANGHTPDGTVGQQTWGLLAPDIDDHQHVAGADDDQVPKLAMQITAAELDSCDVPEMEEEAV